MSQGDTPDPTEGPAEHPSELTNPFALRPAVRLPVDDELVVEISSVLEISSLAQASGLADEESLEGDAPRVVELEADLPEPITDIGRPKRNSVAPGLAVGSGPASAGLTGSAAQRLIDAGLIARGGMATIHRVFDRNIRRHVALKRVDPELVESTPDVRQLLVEEAQITGQLDHPNIVPIYDLGLDADGSPLFTMKLVHGQTLTQLIRLFDSPTHSHAHLHRLLGVFLKVCDAMSFAHSRGVIHRDLKPDNVMIGSHGQVYVMDWGCALLVGSASLDDSAPEVTVRAAASRRAVPGTVLGTAAYMAPEQAKGGVDGIDARTDVYSLGAILYQVLTSKPPHRGRTFVESVLLAQVGNVMPPQELCPQVDLPRSLCTIAMKALSVAPADRYQTVAEIREAVERFLTGVGAFLERRYEPGEVIVREGEPADAAYIVVRGTCEVSRLVDGKPTSIRRLGAGEVFGETAIITEQARSATVTAVDEVVTTIITRGAFETELGMDSWIGSFVRSLAARFREAERRLEQERRSAIFDKVVDVIRVHLLAVGEFAGDGSIEASWSRLRAAIAHTMGLSGELITQAVLGSAELRLDERRDLIGWRSGPSSAAPLEETPT